MSDTTTTATQQGEALRVTATKWLERIADAQKREKVWRDDAAKAVRAYTGEDTSADVSEAMPGVSYDFNILFSNVETIVPAVINSPPAPDVRRRFGSDDPVARDFAELLERAMHVQVDDGRLQVEMEAMAQDGFLAGRGVIRIRFHSDFVGGEATREDLKEADRATDPVRPQTDDIEPVAVEETLENERIGFEAVSWRDCAHGPAKRWEDVPWWAFRHSMPDDEVETFSDAALVKSQGNDDRASDDADTDREVWEIWDRKSKTVIFIAATANKVIQRIRDPLGLSRFFPIATPVQPIEITGRLMPVNPFSLYSQLADELDTTTKRIRAITKQLKVKGWYGFDPTDLQSVLDADDNEFVPITNPELWAANKGMGDAIAFWPVEKLVLVLAQLYQMRDQTKQSIYEITGISDIVRGASKSGETLGAQQIKTQWGSLRIQKMQRMMERAARDLFLMMAEIIPTKFSAATLSQMTDIQIEPTEADLQPIQMPPMMGHNGGPPMGVEQAQPDPAQAEAQQKAMQAAQEAEQKRQEKLQHLEALQALMQKRAASYYRIDVETDSTVKADLTRQKQEATDFMTAASGYFAAVGPLVQQGALPMDVAVEIFASFSRLFNLGKSVEDALDEMVERAKDAAGQAPQADPAKAAAEADVQAKQAETAARVKDIETGVQLKQMDGQIRQETARADIALKSLDQVSKRADLQIKGVDLEIRQAELALKQKQLFAPPAPAGEGFARG